MMTFIKWFFILYVLVCVCLLPWGIHKGQINQERIRQENIVCKQVCGEKRLILCNKSTDEILCDEHTIVHHFPK